jgi:5-methyltetrahydropteroyltriglutamate--homocysteine methyltransferase
LCRDRGDWDLDTFLWGDWHGEQVGDRCIKRPPIAVLGRLRRRRFLSAKEFVYARGPTARIVKVTLPSPSLFALVRLGCEYVQLDAPHYPLLLDPACRDFYASRGWPAQRWLDLGVELDNIYDWLAQRLFPRVRAQRLLLEYDDERSGGFEPLAAVPQDKIVVLGLVTTETGRRETVDELETRIREAARHLSLERLALSAQCGFTTSILGNAAPPLTRRPSSGRSLRPPDASGNDGRPYRTNALRSATAAARRPPRC